MVSGRNPRRGTSGTVKAKKSARRSLENVKISIPGAGFFTMKKSHTTGKFYGRKSRR